MAVLQAWRGFYLWKYVPSIPAASIFTALFTLSLILIPVRIFQTRTWFAIPFVIGAVFEMVGYIARLIAHNTTGSLIPYIIQSILILLAPALFAASIYMILSRLMLRLRAPAAASLVPVRWLTPLFVTGDVVSFFVQGGGAGIQVREDRASRDAGKWIIVGGLVVQIAWFGFFAVTAGVFHRRMGRAAKAGGGGVSGSMAVAAEEWKRDGRWRRMLGMLYAVSALIMVRSVFRLIEYVQGLDGYLYGSEWTLYIFDAVPMWLVTLAFWWWYPSGLAVPKEVTAVDGESARSDFEMLDSAK